MTVSLHLGPQIRAFGQSAGRQFTPAEVRAIETATASMATVGDDGHVRFNIGAGPVATLDDALVAASVGMGSTASTQDTSTQTTINPWKAGPGFNRTAQAVLTNKDPALAARLRNEASAR